MSTILSSVMIASGALLASRIDCEALRLSGGAMIVGSLVIAASPAAAQEHILAVDNGEVRCKASKSDLTRIALKDDQFIAVSRVQSGVPGEDFSIVHEPTRGDLYLSVPQGYAKPNISFFGTTKKGFVYRFDCRVSGEGALQVFVANADIENPQPPAETLQANAPLETQAVGLVRAMFEQRPVTGFDISDAARAPVNVGTLKVQLITQYRSPTITGKVLRIENTGDAPLILNEQLIAGDAAIAVTISNPNLERGQATAAYVVVPSKRGDPQ
ncbi:MAG: type-F conjugative transfer system secretin TraK [Pseudomonadota bacterium]